MEQTKEMKQIIAQIIQDIQEQQSYRAVEAGDDVRVIEDLGFSSLDIAQLVAQMEMETGVDPFSKEKRFPALQPSAAFVIFIKNIWTVLNHENRKQGRYQLGD
ncbi:hypothetical protein NNL12_12790 [Bacillus velezensis]|nr:hypothetical protein NNL12_12790 [Bacillus velezensis]